jgi:hypothetical protein
MSFKHVVRCPVCKVQMGEITTNKESMWEPGVMAALGAMRRNHLTLSSKCVGGTDYQKGWIYDEPIAITDPPKECPLG